MHLPPELVTYMTYCRNLSFDDRPDYTYLRQLLVGSMLREGHQYDFVFDWTISNRQSTHGMAMDRDRDVDEELVDDVDTVGVLPQRSIEQGHRVAEVPSRTIRGT